MRSIEVPDGTRIIPHELVIPSGQVPLTMRALHSLYKSHWDDPTTSSMLERACLTDMPGGALPDDRAALGYHNLVGEVLTQFERHEGADFAEGVQLRGTAIPLIRTAILGGLSLRGGVTGRRVAEDMIANPVRMTPAEFQVHIGLHPNAWKFDERPFWRHQED